MYCLSNSNHAERLQPDVVALERVFKVYGQFVAISIGRATVELPSGVGDEKNQQ